MLVGAIAGLSLQDGNVVVSDALPRVARALAHRGHPTTWMGGPVGLTAFASRPHIDAQTGVVIVADARIDNRTELPAAGLSDAELILAAYREWGSECVSRLLGDF